MDIRKKLVDERRKVLNRMDDATFTRSINEYFAKNPAMPGEGWLKTEAAKVAAFMEDAKDSPEYNPDDLYPAEPREEYKDAFAEMAVKSTRLKNIAVRPGMEAGGTSLETLSGFPGSEDLGGGRIRYTMYGETDARMPGKVIFGNGIMMADIPEKFMKAHPYAAGDIMVEATDYSNGKGKNVSYDMYIDLTQNDEANMAAREEIDTETRLTNKFHKYVPVYGPSPVVGGEMVRAVNRIDYRWFNDGDKLGDGYGRETVNPAARYLMVKGTPDVKVALENMWAPYTGYLQSDDVYEANMRTLVDAVLKQLDENPQLFTERNTEDYQDYADPEEDYDDSYEDEDEYYEEEEEDEYEDEDEEEYEDFADAVDSLQSGDGLEM